MSRRRIFLFFCALAAPLALVAVLTAGPASARPLPAGPHIAFSPTGACSIQLPGQCLEVGAAQAVPASLALSPADDAAMTVTGPGPVVGSSLDNDQQDGTQDFDLAFNGFVPHPGQPDGPYPFTARDKFLYGGSPVVTVQWVPFGFDGFGVCAQNIVSPVTHVGRVFLRPCDGGADQAWIVTRHVPGTNTAPLPYARVLSVLPTVSLAGHGCLTMTNYLTGAQLTVARCTSVLPGHGGKQYWTRVP